MTTREPNYNIETLDGTPWVAAGGAEVETPSTEFPADGEGAVLALTEVRERKGIREWLAALRKTGAAEPVDLVMRRVEPDTAWTLRGVTITFRGKAGIRLQFESWTPGWPDPEVEDAIAATGRAAQDAAVEFVAELGPAFVALDEEVRRNIIDAFIAGFSAGGSNMLDAVIASMGPDAAQKALALVGTELPGPPGFVDAEWVKTRVAALRGAWESEEGGGVETELAALEHGLVPAYVEPKVEPELRPLPSRVRELLRNPMKAAPHDQHLLDEYRVEIEAHRAKGGARG